MSIPQTGGGPIEHSDQLAEYLAAGCKPRDDWRIGTEHEKFGYCKQSLKPIPYDGTASIFAVLDGLRQRHGWAPVEEAGKLIGLTKDGAMCRWNRVGSWSCLAHHWRQSTRPATKLTPISKMYGISQIL